MNKKAGQLLFQFVFCFVLASCGVLSPDRISSDANPSTDLGNDEISAYTPTGLSLGAEQVTGTPAPPLNGGSFELQVHTVMQVEQDCIFNYPFAMRYEDERILFTGDADVPLTCQFSGEFCNGDCLTIHMDYDFGTRIDGELMLAAKPETGALHAFYFYDGSISIYYTGLPPEAANPFPPENPLQIPLGDIATLVLPFEEGSSVSFQVGLGIDQMPEEIPPENTTWTLVLHLDQ